MAPPGYDPEAVYALRTAATVIRRLLQSALEEDDRDERLPSDLLATLYWATEPVKHLIPPGHGILHILPQLRMSGRSEPKRPDPTWRTVIRYGPTMADLLDDIANKIERTNFGAESNPRSPKVTVNVDPRDRDRRQQRQTPRTSGDPGQ